MRLHLNLTNKYLDVVSKINELKKSKVEVTSYIAESIRIRIELEKKFGSYEDIFIALGSSKISDSKEKHETFSESSSVAILEEHVINNSPKTSNRNIESVFSDFDDLFDN